jgi:hypothetical protein
VSAAAGALPLDLQQLKRKWGVYTPAELKARSHGLGKGHHVIHGLFPERSLVVVVGDSGLGKSPLLYQAAICVASGTPFLDHPVEQGRVLYLDYENGVGEADDLVTRISAYLGLSDLPEGQLLLWNFNDSPPKWGPEQALDLMREVRPHLVIVDSLGSYCPTIEEKNSTATQVFQELRTLIRDCNSTIVGVHHPRKLSDKPEHAPRPLESENLRRWFQQARGARSIVNGSDVRIGIDQPDLSGVLRKGEDGNEEIALVMRGFGRVRGEIPLTYIARVLDDEGEPTGYKKLMGADLLFNGEQFAAFTKLDACFRFKDAQLTYGKGAQATTDFLKKCCNLGILRRAGRGSYEKIKSGGSTEPDGPERAE